MDSVFIVGITCLMVCFSGLSSGQCNLSEVSQCYSGGQPLNNDTTDLQTACRSLNQVMSCLGPYQSPCASDSNFQQMMANLTLVSVFCAAESNCSIQKCYTDNGVDVSNSNGGITPNTSCETLRAVQRCFEGLRSACEGNVLYTMVQSLLQQAAALCGGSNCDLLQCFSGAGLDQSILGSDPRNMSCQNFVAVYPCLQNQKSACTGNMMYTMFESYLPDYEGRCGQQGPRDVGNLAIPELWILLPVFLNLLAAISP